MYSRLYIGTVLFFIVRTVDKMRTRRVRRSEVCFHGSWKLFWFNLSSLCLSMTCALNAPYVPAGFLALLGDEEMAKYQAQ